MFQMMRRTPAPGRADPAPSRWAWRMQRLMLTPTFRLGLRAGLPFCVTLLATTVYLADDARRGAITQGVADARASIEERPEFMVKLMAIDGAQGHLAQDIRTAVPLEFPQSSFDLDLPVIRKVVSNLSGVKSANVRIRPGGILQVDVVARVPVALWRSDEGLMLLDESGAYIATVASRASYPQLPLIAGAGAQDHVAQALKLHRTAAALGPRLRGVVRMGERRWDVVLDRDQRILLPEQDAARALERVIALERAQQVLSRDVAQVDMRLGQRPTIKMTQTASDAWWDVKKTSTR